MTVSSSTDRATFPGNDATTVFPLPFRFFANGEVNAWLITNATGALTPLTLGTHYTLTGASEPEVDGSATGQLTMITPPTSAQSLFVQRIIPVTQPTDIVNQGQFFPEIHENVFDRLTMLNQQNAGALNRTIRVQDFDPEPAKLPSAAQRALKIMSFDASGNPEAIDAASDSSLVLRQDLADDTDPAKGAALVAGAIVQVDDVVALRLLEGRYDGDQVSLLGYYAAKPGVGGGMLRWDAASTATDNGGSVIAVTGVVTGRWIRDDAELDLYAFGGTFAGDCIAAMDAALASGVATIKVPDNVVLGYHPFNFGSVVIRGGANVSFSGAPCGIWPTVGDYVEITGFRDVVLAAYPISGGVIADGQQFIGLGSGADIGSILVTNNSGSGGKIGISVGFESGRTLRDYCEIYNNQFSTQNGSEGGEGYGIHYANENDTGDAYIAMNTVSAAGRHGIYLARNKGGGSIVLVGNTVKNHRLIAPSADSQVRGAIQINRCSNVKGFGNVVDTFKSSAVMVFEETEAVGSPLDSRDVTMVATTIKNPQNLIAAIYIGLTTPSPTAVTQNIEFNGVTFEADGFQTPVINYAWGLDVRFRDVHATYKNFFGTIRPFVVTGLAAADSRDFSMHDSTVICTGCAGSTLQVFRLTGFAVTGDLPMFMDGLTIKSDATTNNAWSMSASNANTKIQAEGVDLTGYTGVRPIERANPSQPWNGQFITSGIATPVANVTPHFIGQDVYLQSNGTFWKAFGLTNADWKQTA